MGLLNPEQTGYKAEKRMSSRLDRYLSNKEDNMLCARFIGVNFNVSIKVSFKGS